jgi:LysM repeat protein
MATATLEGSSVAFQYVTVETGQSLWGVAESIAPNADPRDVIAAIMQLNHLESADVLAGQQLAVPVQYAP